MALPTAAAARKALPARAKVAACHVAATPLESVAAFEARMRSVAGASRMSMRFTLVERFDTRRFEPLKVPDLATWRYSKPGVRVFSYTQRVRALQLGGQYRMRVHFRWHDAAGRTVRSTRRHSGVCGRMGPLPQLQVTDVRGRPGPRAGTADYAVDVTNFGDAEAKNVPVLLVVDGASLDIRSIDSLDPGETATVRFSGPPCAHRLRAEVDPDDEVHESNEDDNRRVVRCSEPQPAELVG